MALLRSIWLYITLPWLYFTLPDSTLLYHGSTSLYLTLLYHGSTSLYLTLHYSTIVQLPSTWLYIVLPWLYLILLDLTSPYHGFTSLYPNTGASEDLAADSCQQIAQLCPNATSDYYWIRTANGSTIYTRLYCDMSTRCGHARLDSSSLHQHEW